MAVRSTPVKQSVGSYGWYSPSDIRAVGKAKFVTQLRLRVADTVALVTVARERAAEVAGPYVIAIDGRSGAGKSTLAARLAKVLDALVIDGDSFFHGGVKLRRDTPEERASRPTRSISSTVP